MAAAVEPMKEKGRPYDPPKRTKALPKHTLFGAEVQHLSEDEKKTMKELDLEKIQENHHQKRVARQQRYKPNLPTYLKKKLSDTSAEEAKTEIQKQLKNTTRAQKDLELLEEKSKYFQVHTVPEREHQSTNNSNNVAKEINNIGPKPGSSSYNRDKYEASHKYSRIGNPMKLGNDFDNKGSPDVTQMPPPEFKRHRAPDWLPAEAYMPEKAEDEDLGLAIDVPANIRHKFGTKVVQEVLSDKKQVEQSLEYQAQVRAASHKSRSSGSPEDFQVANPEYESMSQAVRQNIFPGYSIDYKMSSMKRDYPSSVFDRRIPETDEYRCQRDALTIWNEHQFIADRLAQRWREYEDSQPKLQANWDRNAKRPPPQVKSAPARVKSKPKPKKAKVESKVDEDFPVIEFKTPPATPPPPPPEKMPMPEYVKDDDFWDFYDQPIPK